MKESGVDALIKKTGDTKFGFISKAQSMLTGWDWEESVTGQDCASGCGHCFHHTTMWWGDGGVLHGLLKPTPAVGAGWELNTGVLTVKRSSRGLIEQWVHVFTPETFVEFPKSIYVRQERSQLPP
eukprot:gene14127-30076_t